MEQSRPIVTHTLTDTFTGKSFAFDWETGREDAAQWFLAQHPDEDLARLIEGTAEVMRQRDILADQLRQGYFDSELAEIFSLVLEELGPS